MEIDKNKLNYNNIKLKIKISELKNKSLTLKSFPSLKLNSPKDSLLHHLQTIKTKKTIIK